MLGSRIVVVGTSGTGKSTLARELAHRLGYRHIELDALHWEPGWTPAASDVFRARVAGATSGDGWVLDGNYSKVSDLTWARADTIVWLDLDLPVVLWRVTWRTVRRIRRREVLWGTNTESFRQGFLSRDSIIVWALTTHGRHRRRYEERFADPDMAQLTRLRVRTPRQVARLLSAVDRLGG